MGKKFFLTEDEKMSIRSLYQLNEQEYEEVEVDDDGEEKKMFCNAENTKSLDDIYGDDELHDEMKGIVLVKKNGVKGLADKLEALKSIRMFPGIQDGGELLANSIMGNLKDIRPFNFYDEPSRKCSKAMDKVIELYKEHEHGEELVKDLEKVYGSHNVSQRAKEFLKHGIDLVKGNLDK
jgi:hypothetical protein